MRKERRSERKGKEKKKGKRKARRMRNFRDKRRFSKEPLFKELLARFTTILIKSLFEYTIQ